MTTGAEFQAAALRAKLRERELLEADLRRRIDGLEQAYAEVSFELDRSRAELARLRTVAVDLATRMATMGAVVAHDDVARILAGMLERQPKGKS